MEKFSAGDRVVAINTILNGPICPPPDPSLHPFCFPDGILLKGQVYHVKSTIDTDGGGQGILLTGLRVHWGETEVPWSATRFRKLNFTRTHLPKKRQKNLPQAI
jgi:hypothetical protein